MRTNYHIHLAAAGLIAAALAPQAQAQFGRFAWSQAPQIGVAGSYTGELVYDPFLAATVTFGGQAFNTTSWDGTTHTGIAGRLSRDAVAGVYEISSGAIVAFGGFDGTIPGVTNETHTLGRGANSWTTTVLQGSPAARFAHDMVYDPLRQETLLFGGTGVNNTVLGDFWRYTGGTWTQITPATLPPARRNHAMAYDTARQVVVLFGGEATNGTYLNDLWEWNGSTWSQVTATNTPAQRAGHSMAYDEILNEMIIHGGSDANGLLANTAFAYQPGAFTTILGTSPNARFRGRAAYDASRRRVVLIGGFGSSSARSDVWEWAHPSPATVEPFGSGCAPAGSTVVPRLEPFDHPRLGLSWPNFSPNTIFTRLSDLPPNQTALSTVGLSNTTWGSTPLPFDLSAVGYPIGCSLLVSPDFTGQPFVYSGTSSLMVTSTAGLPLGIPAYMQVLVLSSVNGVGIAATNGLVGVSQIF